MALFGGWSMLANGEILESMAKGGVDFVGLDLQHGAFDFRAAAQGIQLGDTEIVVAGGMESMSNAPYLIPNAREGYRLGNGILVDAMVRDGGVGNVGSLEPRHVAGRAAILLLLFSPDVRG